MTILIVEPFYGGSHKQLVDMLYRHFHTSAAAANSGEQQSSCALFTLPAKKWHWRARTSALLLAQIIPHDVSYTYVIF